MSLSWQESVLRMPALMFEIRALGCAVCDSPSRAFPSHRAAVLTGRDWNKCACHL